MHFTITIVICINMPLSTFVEAFPFPHAPGLPGVTAQSASVNYKLLYVWMPREIP